MCRQSGSNLLPSPADESAVKRYNKHRDIQAGPQLYPLRLDVYGPLSSPWNKRAANIFCQDLRQNSHLYRQLPEASDTLIKETFTTHIRYLRRLYKKNM